MMHSLHAKYDTELASESSTVAIDLWKGSFDFAHMMRFERSGGFQAHRRLDSLQKFLQFMFRRRSFFCNYKGFFQ